MSAWGMLDNKTKNNLEKQLDCCGLLNASSSQMRFEQDVQSCVAVSATHTHTHARKKDM